MRKFGKVDHNQYALVAYARAFGASWLSLASVGNGCPDGLLGYCTQTWLIEFKSEKGALTPDQTQFIATWRGSPVYVIRTQEELERLLRTVMPKKRAPKKPRPLTMNLPPA